MALDYLTREQRQLLADMFREYFEKSGSNIAELSSLLDVSRTTVQGWVYGNVSPKKSNREELARKVFKMTPIELEAKLFGESVEVEKNHEEVLTAIRLAPPELFQEIREAVYQRETEELEQKNTQTNEDTPE